MAEKQSRNRGKGKPFKPGQSGNPKGRPKKGDSVAEMIRDIGNEDASKTNKKSKWEFCIRKQFEKAAKGSTAALAWLKENGFGKLKQDVGLDLEDIPMPFFGVGAPVGASRKPKKKAAKKKKPAKKKAAKK